MKELLQALQARLATVEHLRYIDSDWGQMNLEQPPVKYPAALIDIQSAEYSNQGRRAQRGVVKFVVTLCKERLSRTNIAAKPESKESAAKFWELYRDVNCALHTQPLGIENFGAPVRLGMQHKVARGIEQIAITYQVAFADLSTEPTYIPSSNVKVKIKQITLIS
ncbi:MAG: hypothetical protein LBN95_07050 [Prevotellaceae bacterium]|jgi:hypothetical protein|nr:hypothetical protein [Prevotellaceae bacterium]